MEKGNRGWNLRGNLQPRRGMKAERNPGWKGDAARPETKRARAQRAYPLAACERCGKPATDRHHRDGDTGNNAPENILRLCRRCHMDEDGRLAKFHATCQGFNPQQQPPKPCVTCGRLSKPLRRGRCQPCSEYLRRRGVERPYVNDGRREKAAREV